jgi:hypothetical protein
VYVDSVTIFIFCLINSYKREINARLSESIINVFLYVHRGNTAVWYRVMGYLRMDFSLYSHKRKVQ